MTAGYRSIFDSADWIAALDREWVALPPADAPAVDAFEVFDEALPDAAPVTWEAPAARRKRLLNWQIAVVYGLIHTGLVTTVIGLAGASAALGLLSLAVHGAALAVGLGVGIPLNRRRYP